MRCLYATMEYIRIHLAGLATLENTISCYRRPVQYKYMCTNNIFHTQITQCLPINLLSALFIYKLHTHIPKN